MEVLNQAHYCIGSDFSSIGISPRPSANDPLTGGDTLGARCSELSNQPNMVQCRAPSTPPLPPLIDGDLGPEGASYTNTMVHAWHRSTGTVTIEYIIDSGSGVEIRHINLYFYSITSMGIGLPSVTVYRGSTVQVVEYHIFGNDDITQEDNMRRQILLSLRSTGSSRLSSLTLRTQMWTGWCSVRQDYANFHFKVRIYIHYCGNNTGQLVCTNTNDHMRYCDIIYEINSK